MVATLVLETSAERRVGSSPTWGTILKHIVCVNRGSVVDSVFQYGKCESGVKVATGDLKSPVLGRAGSIPASRTKFLALV